MKDLKQTIEKLISEKVNIESAYRTPQDKERFMSAVTDLLVEKEMQQEYLMWLEEDSEITTSDCLLMALIVSRTVELEI